jgi:hypothetical protein
MEHHAAIPQQSVDMYFMNNRFVTVYFLVD